MELFSIKIRCTFQLVSTLLDGLELVSLHDGLDHIGYLMLDIPLPVIDGSQRQGFPSLHLLGG